jgi:hypothetical protein
MSNLNGKDNSGLALLNISWLGREVGDVNYRFRCQHATNVGFWVGIDWCALDDFAKGGLCRL